MEAALIDYSMAIDIDQKNHDACFNSGRYNLEYLLGCALVDLGRKEEAIIDYSKTIEIYPDDGSYHNRGFSYIHYYSGITLSWLGRK